MRLTSVEDAVKIGRVPSLREPDFDVLIVQANHVGDIWLVGGVNVGVRADQTIEPIACVRETIAAPPERPAEGLAVQAVELRRQPVHRQINHRIGEPTLERNDH